MNNKVKKYIRHILFAAAGSGIGYFINFFIGCPTGTCAVTSNPYSSMAFMALVGWLISVSLSKRCDGCNT
ncbi:MAG: hypothetical protein IIW08_01415 [Clostridia bacterium]|nr:hypothetical protein [Clostridia bacterium]MBQ2433522.1 hypothetical protein [Clostridia bacterium]MBQ5769815.1 hypothetical protein [Clostridia bacterium]